jgi:hypothetical protein
LACEIIALTVGKISEGMDLPGLALILFSFSLVFYPFLIVTACLHGQLDPYYISVAMFSPHLFQNSTTVYFIAVIRVVILSVLLTETSRIASFGVLALISMLRMFHKTISIIVDCTWFSIWACRKFNFTKFLQSYTQAAIILQNLKYLQVSLLLFVGTASVSSILLNFCILKGYRSLPFVIYFYCVLTDLLIFITIQMTVPMSGKVSEASQTLLNRWKTSAMQMYYPYRNYYVRKIRSLSPLTMGGGINGLTLFYFKRSTRVTLYTGIISYTITLLLAVPQEVFERKVRLPE